MQYKSIGPARAEVWPPGWSVREQAGSLWIGEAGKRAEGMAHGGCDEAWGYRVTGSVGYLGLPLSRSCPLVHSAGTWASLPQSGLHFLTGTTVTSWLCPVPPTELDGGLGRVPAGHAALLPGGGGGGRRGREGMETGSCCSARRCTMGSLTSHVSAPSMFPGLPLDLGTWKVPRRGMCGSALQLGTGCVHWVLWGRKAGWLCPGGPRPQPTVPNLHRRSCPLRRVSAVRSCQLAHSVPPPETRPHTLWTRAFPHRPLPSPPLPCLQVSLDVLSDSYRSEQDDYYLHTSQWTDTHPQQLLGSASAAVKYDLGKVTLDEIKVGTKDASGWDSWVPHFPALGAEEKGGYEGAYHLLAHT